MANKKMKKTKKTSISKKSTPKKKKLKRKSRSIAKPSTPAAKSTLSRDVKRQSGGVKSAVVGGASIAGAAAVAGGLEGELTTLEDRLGDLQDSLLLNRARDQMGDIESALSMLPAEVEAVRTRGYAFRSFLDRKAEVLTEQWAELRDSVAQEIERQTRDLERDAAAAESALRQAAASGSSAQIRRASTTIDTLEHKVSAAQSAVEAMYQNIQTNIHQCRSQVQEITWLLDQVDEASFDVYPAEDPVLAVRAQYMESEKDGPEGVLFLTDERLVFEQKEEVATKKVLFIATEKETVQETVFAVTVGHIEEVNTSEKGFLGRKQLLDIKFAPEADLSGATLRLIGADNEEWAALIGRVRSSEIDNERARPKDQAAVDAARKAPTKCPTCGATLDVEIVRGMREIKCPYCGSIVRL
jgi:hypothetical protein